MSISTLLKSRLQDSEEFKSALVRLLIWCFAATYVWLGAISDYYQVNMTSYVVLFSIYLILFIFILISVIQRPDWEARRYLSLTMDVTAATLALFLTGDATSPFYILYFWIFISYGTRYGKNHLFVASILSIIAYLIATIVLEGWTNDSFEISFILISLVMLPLYQFALIRKLYAAQKNSEASNQAKSTFLANMSHEIRTPLNGLMSMGELLLRGPLETSQREYAEKLVHSGRSLNTIINEILDYSKIESGHITINPIAFSVKTLVKDIHDLLLYGIESKGLSFTCEVGDQVPDVLCGDSARIRQVLINLIGNATHFTSQGGITLKIELIKQQRHEHHLKFSVIDTGTGIPPHQMDRLFKRFSQVDDSLTRHHGGSGLGLVISKGLVEAMGGEIGVESSLHHGSTFWFSMVLPLGMLKTHDQRIEEKSAKLEIANLNILLVDDDAINRLAGKRLMESEGHHVKLAINGIDAIEQLHAHEFDLILMDVHMPEMDGIEATIQIRKTFDSAGALIPIIGLTASVMEDERKRYLAAGMNSVVAKPIDLDALNQHIYRLCAPDVVDHSSRAQ